MRFLAPACTLIQEQTISSPSALPVRVLLTWVDAVHLLYSLVLIPKVVSIVVELSPYPVIATVRRSLAADFLYLPASQTVTLAISSYVVVRWSNKMFQQFKKFYTTISSGGNHDLL